MVECVDPEKIESIVGRKRHPSAHYARAVSAEETVYILHSATCFAAEDDLRECPYSVALDRHGINVRYWTMDVPLPVVVLNGRLFPVTYGT